MSVFRPDRDPRFPPHKDIEKAILELLRDKQKANVAEIRDELAAVFGMSEQLRREHFLNGMPIWNNYVAHGLAQLRRQRGAPMPLIELVAGSYALTELGWQHTEKRVSRNLRDSDGLDCATC